MPYRDPERKKEWERLHRVERLARRRQLRHMESGIAEARYQQPEPEFGSVVPTVDNTGLNVAVGGLTLVSSAGMKKAGIWWLVGCVILVLVLFLYFRKRQVSRKESTKPK